jgi:hypothetical protein
MYVTSLNYFVQVDIVSELTLNYFVLWEHSYEATTSFEFDNDWISINFVGRNSFLKLAFVLFHFILLFKIGEGGNMFIDQSEFVLFYGFECNIYFLNGHYLELIHCINNISWWYILQGCKVRPLVLNLNLNQVLLSYKIG